MTNPDDSAVFVHAWWRSSSTYLRNKLRANEALCCFTEPLHEAVGHLTPKIVHAPVDPAAVQALHHPETSRNYYAEYAPLVGRDFGWRKALSYDRYYLAPQEPDPDLEAYLGRLIDSARARGQRPVLAFCRSGLRAAWMKRRFGGLHLALLRDPREQWGSMLEQHEQGGTYFLAGMLAIAGRLRTRFPRAFAHLECDLPDFRADVYNPREQGHYLAQARKTRPYELYAVFALIWLASALQTLSVADIVLDINHLSSDLEVRDAATEQMRAAGLPVDFSDLATPGHARLPLAAEALGSIENAAAHALGRNAVGLVVTIPRRVQLHAGMLGPRTRDLLALCLQQLPLQQAARDASVQA